MSKANLAAAYTGAKGDAYFKGRQQNMLLHLGYKLQAKFYRPYLRTDMNVLDFGCGNGSMAACLRDAVRDIEGVEVNELPRKLAQSAFDLTIYDSLTSVPTARQYDAIISNHVLEHVPNPSAMLRDLARHLKPGGIVVVMVPIEDFRTPRNRNWQSPDVNGHLHTWAPLQFAHTLREAGLESVELRVIAQAWTHRAFFLGDTALQTLFGRLFSRLRRRRQLLAVARRPAG